MRINLLTILIFISYFCFTKINAQTIQIKEESTLKPISFVSALNNNTKEWFISDSLGVFKFKNFNSITIDVIGFERKTVYIKADSIIYLKPTSINLKEVIVKNKPINKKPRKTFKSKNGLTYFYGYRYSSLATYKKNIACLVYFPDTLNQIRKVSIDAEIYGNKNNQFARFKLYKVNYNDLINSVNYREILKNYNEVYSYELKDTYPDNKKNLTFTLPDGIILSNGNYLFSIEATPSQNPSQKLILNLSKDKHLHTFFKLNKAWSHDFDNGKFLNMKIKVDYDVL
jgi:hypothetical protein